MRRAILAVVIGLIGQAFVELGEAARAGDWYGYPSNNRYGGYGRQLRGGYGKNGFAPVCGPVWGPTAFIYANGRAMDPRPHGSYVRPLYPPPEMMFGPEPLPAIGPDATVAPPYPQTETDAK